MQNHLNNRAGELIFRIHHVLNITDNSYLIRFDRHDLPFEPGQHVLLGEGDSLQMREYSVFSGMDDPFFEVLIREVKDGYVSRRLRKLKKGAIVQVEGPVGYFTIKDDDIDRKSYLFIASGTGIAPFHSFVKSYKSLNYSIVHGTKLKNENYGIDCFEPARHLHCVSREDGGDFQGRVTDFLKQMHLDPDLECYLCGNSDMIIDAIEILKLAGIPDHQIHTEIYF